MIKRIGASALTLLYLVTVIGFAMNVHYCFGYVSSVNINAPAKNCDTRAWGKMKCCKDKHFEVKVKDAHQAEANNFLAKNIVFELPVLAFADFSFWAKQYIVNNDFNRGPPVPVPNHRTTFLKNRIFRI